MKRKVVSITELRENTENPRYITKVQFNKLVKSLTDFPDMLEARPVVVDETMTILGGNMRIKALREAGIDKVPVVVAEGWDEERKREFIVKDNLSYGEWDWDALANEWGAEQLDDWGLETGAIEKTPAADPRPMHVVKVVCGDEDEKNKLIGDIEGLRGYELAGRISATPDTLGFQYYGGKKSKLGFILPLLPQTKAYIEPFAGSAAVLLNKPPAEIELLNDADKAIWNLHLCLQKKIKELQKACAAMQYSQAQHRACRQLRETEPAKTPDTAHAAATLFDIFVAFSSISTGTTRIANTSNLAENWQLKVRKLSMIPARLAVVQMTNMHVLDFFKRVGKMTGKDELLIYADPPYHPDICDPAYKISMSAAEHEEFCRECLKLAAAGAKIAVSGYETDLYNSAFADWHTHKLATKTTASSKGNKQKRTEIVWCNYEVLGD